MIGHAMVLAWLCMLLFPESMQGRPHYRDYFLQHQAASFGIVATNHAMNFVDIGLKGRGDLDSFRHELPVHRIIVMALCIVAIRTRSGVFHTLLAAAMVGCQLLWIARFSGTLA